MSEKLNLLDDGVTMIDYPEELHRDVQQVALLWQQFCELSPEVKNLFTTTNNHNGVGYEFKSGEGISNDIKENFDYSAIGLPYLEDAAKRSGNATALQFIDAIKQLNIEVRPMIESFGQHLETRYNLSGASELAAQSAPDAFFRFLHYPSRENVGSVIAEAHTDHSGFTFHLYESTEGCERCTFDGDWQPLPVAHTEAAAFLGMQSQLIAKSELKALTHQVIVNETTAKFGRFAIVCFVALKTIPGYDRETYGRLQAMHRENLGFNYTLSHEEFSKLFKRS